MGGWGWYLGRTGSRVMSILCARRRSPSRSVGLSKSLPLRRDRMEIGRGELDGGGRGDGYRYRWLSFEDLSRSLRRSLLRLP